MILAATGFAFGVILFQQMPWLPSPGWLLLLLPVLCLPRQVPAAWLGAAVLSGFFWSFGYALWTEPEEIPENLLQDKLIAEGVVLGLPQAVSGQTRFYFQARVLDAGGQRLTGSWKLRLVWYRDAPSLSPGERWRLPLRLKLAHGYRNPGGFDYEGWLYARGVRYTGYVKLPGAEKLGVETGPVDALRLQLEEYIVRAGVSDSAAGVLKALVVGDRSGLSHDQKRLFSLTGTSHLIAISGLHVGLVAGLVYLLFHWLWRRFPRLCGRWPAAVAAILPALAAALMYAALAGFAIPTRRALIMLMLLYLAILLRRHSSGLHVLSLALVLILILDPLAVLSAGFWLSFAAVGAIIWMLSAGLPYPWFFLQFGIALALAPVLVWLDLPVSLVGPLVNMLAIPLFSLLIVPLALAGGIFGLVFPVLGDPLLHTAGWLLDYFLLGLQWTVEREPKVSLLAMPLAGLYGLLVLSGVLSVLFWKARPFWRPLPFLPGILALVLLLHRTPVPAQGSFRFTLLDVGQGLSAVIRTANHVLVFDTGPAFPSGFNTGDAVLLPWLKRQGVDKVDLLLLSHSDVDHVGGAAALVQGMPVLEILSGEPVSLKGAHARRCRAGRLWWWDGVRFDVLYPPSGAHVEGNDASCVLRVSSRGQSVLLTGDIEKAAERWLLKHRKRDLRSTLVVAAHHGSSSSSTREFIHAVAAKQVLYSAGRHNRWGFPRPDVRARWRNAGSQEANTADQGALQALLGRHGDQSVLARRVYHKHYWHR